MQETKNAKMQKTSQNSTSIGEKAKYIFQKMGVSIGLILLIIIASILSPSFLNLFNLMNIARQVAITGIIAVGMTFVILTGGIDLSVGSIVGAVAVVAASLLSGGTNVFLAILAGLAIGLLLGAINGFGITKGKMQPFIMTLAMMVAARGAALTFSDGRPISLGAAAGKFSWLGAGMVGIIPVPVIIFAVIIVISYFVLKYTFLGRYIYAIGGNEESARLSGINVDKIEASAYAICGFLSGLAGLMWVSRLTVGEPTAGNSAELDAIAMVVIGGTSLKGGEGGVLGTVIGAMLIAVLANVLNLLGVTPFSQKIFKGLIIVAAVLIERWRSSN